MYFENWMLCSLVDDFRHRHHEVEALQRKLLAMPAMATMKGSSNVPIKSPSMLLSYAISLSFMLTGASVVHNIFKPDLMIPEVISSSGKDEEAKVVNADS